VLSAQNKPIKSRFVFRAVGLRTDIDFKGRQICLPFFFCIFPLEKANKASHVIFIKRVQGKISDGFGIKAVSLLSFLLSPIACQNRERWKPYIILLLDKGDTR
jgi:hypothetical protein